MYRLQKLYQKPDGKLSSWKNPSHAMWLCVFVRTCLQGSYLEISWFRNRRFWRSVKCWDVDSVHPLDGKCQDQYQLTFLTFLTCGNMTARDFFFLVTFWKSHAVFVGEKWHFFLKGRHMKSIWWKCGFVLFRYLTRYFFPSWFHRIIHQWLAPLNCPSWPWTVEGWGVDPVRVEANGPHPKRADTEIFFEETVGHTQTYNYRL